MLVDVDGAAIPKPRTYVLASRLLILVLVHLARQHLPRCILCDDLRHDGGDSRFLRECGSGKKENGLIIQSTRLAMGYLTKMRLWASAGGRLVARLSRRGMSLWLAGGSSPQDI